MHRSQKLDELWWKCFLLAIQSSGPTFIKLGQWASTRRDIFNKTVCDRLSILHTNTRRQRYFRDYETVIDDIFGKGFVKKYKNTVFTSIEPYSIGSGCIAQVYKATISVPALELALGKRIPELAGYKEKEIAIKVTEKGMEEKIVMDLSILRGGAYVLQWFVPSLSYLEPISALTQFEIVLKKQLDLRNEAKALLKFSRNFDHKKTGIIFPVVIGYSRNAIAETFERGIYINKIVSGENSPQLSLCQSKNVRERIALLGMRALLKMIFVDNFIHGDLHPGNILIRFNNEDNMPGVHKSSSSESITNQAVDFVRNLTGWRSGPCIRFTNSAEIHNEPTLILLDAGIAIAETEENLNNLKRLFKAIVKNEGFKAGKLLLTHLENINNCQNPEKFCQQVDDLVSRAIREKSLNSISISAILSEMLSVVANHNVYLDSSFTAVILSVMVLEGLGRSLDPDIDLFKCARSYLFNLA